MSLHRRVERLETAREPPKESARMPDQEAERERLFDELFRQLGFEGRPDRLGLDKAIEKQFSLVEKWKEEIGKGTTS